MKYNQGDLVLINTNICFQFGVVLAQDHEGMLIVRTDNNYRAFWVRTVVVTLIEKNAIEVW